MIKEGYYWEKRQFRKPHSSLIDWWLISPEGQIVEQVISTNGMFVVQYKNYGSYISADLAKG